MSVYSIYFSPTGGTERVLKIFEDEFKADKRLDLSDEDFFPSYQFCEDDICLIATATFGGRIPTVAEARMQQLCGRGARAILIAVYGNRAFDDVLLELRDVAQGHGFRPIAAMAVSAEHSILRQFGAGRPDAEDQKQLKEFALKIRGELECNPNKDDVAVPGNRPYRPGSNMKMKPLTTDACTRCGLCVDKCPAGAISKDNPSIIDTSKCIVCMRCIAICPEGARVLDAEQLSEFIPFMQSVCGDRKDNKLYL